MSETKKGRPRTSDEGRDRPQADTKVTEGNAGMKRLEKLAQKVLRSP